MARGLVVGNWKMHGDRRANEALLGHLRQAPDGARQMAGIEQALDAAASGNAPEGADGVVARIERATASLTSANG